jgi:hypothetical protein
MKNLPVFQKTRSKYEDAVGLSDITYKSDILVY